MLGWIWLARTGIDSFSECYENKNVFFPRKLILFMNATSILSKWIKNNDSKFLGIDPALLQASLSSPRINDAIKVGSLPPLFLFLTRHPLCLWQGETAKLKVALIPRWTNSAPTYPLARGEFVGHKWILWFNSSLKCWKTSFKCIFYGLNWSMCAQQSFQKGASHNLGIHRKMSPTALKLSSITSF